MNLKIVSFNIRCCDDNNGHSIPERAPRLIKILKELSPDIISFQEYTPAWKTFIDVAFGTEYEIFNKYRKETNHESCPMLWKKERFGCQRRGWFWLSDTPEKESGGWDTCGCYRICEYAVLADKQTGICFNAMNTHFGFGDDNQVKSAQLIYDKMKSISDLPSFVTGDFNMKPDMAGYKKMTGFLTDLNAVTEKDWSTTYHGYEPEKYAEHIDYCFVNEKIVPCGVKVIRDTFDGKYPSDHFGLCIDIEIKG